MPNLLAYTPFFRKFKSRKKECDKEDDRNQMRIFNAFTKFIVDVSGEVRQRLFPWYDQDTPFWKALRKADFIMFVVVILIFLIVCAYQAVSILISTLFGA